MSVLKVLHSTIYRYSEPVGFGPHRWMFRPRDSQEQRLIQTEFSISPEPSELKWVHDIFNNQIAIAWFETQATELIFESNITLEHTANTGPRFRTDEQARTFPFEYEIDSLPDLAEYRRVHYPDPLVEDWARQFRPASGTTSTADLLLKLTHAVREACRYTRRDDPGTQMPSITLGKRSGTCRDFALLMMEAARYLGFAARFVTGYIYIPTRDKELTRGGGATHAWVQIFLPGAGWVEFDPTNGIAGNRDLIRVGVARDPRQAKPLTGSFTGNRAAYRGMEIDVTVNKLNDDNPSAGAMMSFRG